MELRVKSEKCFVHIVPLTLHHSLFTRYRLRFTSNDNRVTWFIEKMTHGLEEEG